MSDSGHMLVVAEMQRGRAQRMKLRRIRARLTQKPVAACMGISVGILSALENNKRHPSVGEDMQHERCVREATHA